FGDRIRIADAAKARKPLRRAAGVSVERLPQTDTAAAQFGPCRAANMSRKPALVVRPPEPPVATLHRIIVAREFAREADIVAVARVHARDARKLVVAGAMMLRGLAVSIGAQLRRPRNDAAGIIAVDAEDAPHLGLSRGGEEQRHRERSKQDSAHRRPHW